MRESESSSDYAGGITLPKGELKFSIQILVGGHTTNKSTFLKYSLISIITLFLLLFPSISYAKKIKLSKSLILEQNNSLDSNYSYKNQNIYFDQIYKNNIDHDSDNLYSELNSLFIITKRYSKSKKIGFSGNIRTNYSNKSDKNDQYHAFLDKSYFFLHDIFGELQLGRAMPINHKMAISSNNFARGSGGVHGGYLQYLNLPILKDASNPNISQIGSCIFYGNNNSKIIENGNCSNIKLPKFILLPISPVAHGGYAASNYHNVFNNNYNNLDDKFINFGENKSNHRINGDNSLGNIQNSFKLNYNSKRINGFKAGIGYSLNAKNDWTIDPNNDIKSNISDIYSWGLNYSNYFENIGFAASITGEYGKISKIHNQYNLNSYEIGAMLTYFGFAIGGSYGNWGNSLTPKSGIYSCDYNQNLEISNQNCSSNAKKFDDAYFINAGISYEFGPFGTSITYLKSNFQENIYESNIFSLDYKLQKSLKSYIEFVKFDFDSNHAKFFNGTNIIDQSSLPSHKRQIQDNGGYIILTGILFKF
jgi:hypothetical protein